MNRHTIVVVTYNRLSLLQECVDAILNQTRPYDRVVIVDNASTDGTGAYLDSLRDNPLFVILSEENNLGGAGGFAEGIRAAYQQKPEWITIIDDDSILEPDFLEQIQRGIDEQPETCVCMAGIPLTDGILI